MPVNIDLLKCTGCGACTFECPVGALIIEDMKCRLIGECIDCGACVERCSFKAITLEEEKAEKAK